MTDRRDDLRRIDEALAEARRILARFTPGEIGHQQKSGGDPVTEADLAVNEALRGMLPRDGEGWLSEETADDPSRLGCSRVWIVDPLDGTREFVAGIPEWCVSIGLVVDGEAVAGGISNPASGETVIGAVGLGVELNGRVRTLDAAAVLAGTTVLASRSEMGRGEWQRFDTAPFTVRPMGSVAYKLGLVAAGLAAATFTLVPKHEWDVAGGVALVAAAGGAVWIPGGERPRFNRERPKLPGLVATTASLEQPLRAFLQNGRG